MKQIDYFWPKTTVQITTIIFVVQLLTELIGNRKQGYEWVLPMCSIVWLASCIWVFYAVVINAIRARSYANDTSSKRVDITEEHKHD
jgi:uncharacterized protein with PQ loop repeat